MFCDDDDDDDDDDVIVQTAGWISLFTASRFTSTR